MRVSDIELQQIIASGGYGHGERRFALMAADLRDARATLAQRDERIGELESERDALALQVADMREALEKAEASFKYTINQADYIPQNQAERDIVRIAGALGYGNVMSLVCSQWRRQNDGGAFAVGPCDSMCEQAMSAIQAALSTPVTEAEARVKAWREKAEKYDAINTPELMDFLSAAHKEALHQRDKWGTSHDGGKTPMDWFWLVGYLAGKALNSQMQGDQEKYLHHCVTTAAAVANWHSAALGATNMRPGCNPEQFARCAAKEASDAN